MGGPGRWCARNRCRSAGAGRDALRIDVRRRVVNGVCAGFRRGCAGGRGKGRGRDGTGPATKRVASGHVVERAPARPDLPRHRVDRDRGGECAPPGRGGRVGLRRVADGGARPIAGRRAHSRGWRCGVGGGRSDRGGRGRCRGRGGRRTVRPDRWPVRGGRRQRPTIRRRTDPRAERRGLERDPRAEPHEPGTDLPRRRPPDAGPGTERRRGPAARSC